MRIHELTPSPQPLRGTSVELNHGKGADPFRLDALDDNLKRTTIMTGSYADCVERNRRIRAGEDPEYRAPTRTTVAWEPDRTGEDYATVWVDVAKLDAAWRRDDGYIGPGGQGGIKNALGHRYQQFDRWFHLGIPVKTAFVNIPHNRPDAVGFGNGRHRFSWMRDHGVRALPITTTVEDAPEIERRYGTAERTTDLPA